MTINVVGGCLFTKKDGRCRSQRTICFQNSTYKNKNKNKNKNVFELLCP